MLSTKDQRSIIAVQARANRWRITGFDVRTPLDPAGHTLVTYAVAELLDGAGAVTASTPLRASVYDATAIGSLLTAVAQAYEKNVASGMDRSTAMYGALRATLYAAKQADGDFPSDAIDATVSLGVGTVSASVGPTP